jgi:hypothetical protein
VGYLTRYRPTRIDLLVVAIIVVVGLVKLSQPFMGDQALATIMASKMSRGEIIYRDLWDLKQPGIFGFYLIGGILFGFNEIGIHTFELLYMVSFSVVQIFALKDYFRNRTVASLAPLFTIGVYYTIAGVWHQTQTEAVVGFPIFLSLWFAWKASRSGQNLTAYLFASGLMGGIVVLFKLMFLPIVVAFWLVFGLTLPRESLSRHPLRPLRLGAAIIFGLQLPITGALIYFGWHNILDLVLWTWFEYPLHLLREVPPDTRQLAKGLGWFLMNFSSIMAFALIGMVGLQIGRRDVLTVNLILWFALGFCAILLQRMSWWQYHYLL